MQSVDPVTVALGEGQPCVGRAEGLLRQGCCMNIVKSEESDKTSRTAVGVGETVLWMTSL